MKLFTPLAAILATASAIQVYQHHQPSYQQVHPIESYAHSSELYQHSQEFQQQGLYSGQSQGIDNQAGSYQAPQTGEKTAKILHHNLDINEHNYQYSYETDNGIKQQEVGETVEGTKAQGEYSYTGDDGQVYSISYTADENGFRAEGSHLPTPPPLPEAIAKALEQNSNDEANGIFDDGQYKPESEAISNHRQQETQQSQQQQIQHQQNHQQLNKFQGRYQQNAGYRAPQVQVAAQYHQYFKH